MKPIPLTSFRDTHDEDAEPLFQSRDEITTQRRKAKRAHAKGREALLYCTLAASIVLIINVGIAIAASTSPAFQSRANGLPAISVGDCASAGRWSMGIHVLINAFSTILLGCSNYCMQNLVACTREEADRAHQEGTWVHVGSQSLRNLRFIPKSRALLWLGLLLSSLPLHLVYNSVSTEYIGINLINAVTLSPDLVFTKQTPKAMQNIVWLDYYGTFDKFVNGTAANFTRISRDECISRYGNALQVHSSDAHWEYQAPYLTGSGGDVAAVTLQTADSQPVYRMLTMNYGMNESGIPFDHLQSTFQETWFCWDEAQCAPEPSPSHRVWPGNVKGASCVFHDCLSSVQKNASLWMIGGHQIDYCLVENVPNQCKIQINLTLLWVVVACNAMKIMCMLLVASSTGRQSMITIGDGIASYSARPDPLTLQRCMLTGKELIRAKENKYGYRIPEMQYMYNTQDGIRTWEEVSERWGHAASQTDWSCCIALSAIVLIGTFVILEMGAKQGLDWSTDWSPITAVNSGHIVNVFDTVKRPDVGLAILVANIPQLVVSVLYFFYNGILTNMLAAKEWKAFGRKPSGLRVSYPQGSQRSTYFLSIPFTYAGPLMACMFLLHWGLSQSIFLVQLEVYRSGQLAAEKDYDQVQLFWNPSAVKVCMGIGIFMLVALIGMGLFGYYPPGPPLRASNSLVISAACHGPLGEESTGTQPVSWGVVGVDGAQTYHCSFSTKTAGLPPFRARCQ